jgi:CRP/FNR family transcriptional regulator, cyclic AMP receptor protein
MHASPILSRDLSPRRQVEPIRTPGKRVVITESQNRNLKILATGEWFGGLPAALQELLVQHSVVRGYRKGEVIYHQDTTSKGLWAVLEGRVRVVRALPGGQEQLFHVGEIGTWFGEFAVLGAGKTLVSVVADTEVSLLVLPKAQFDLIAAEHPVLYKAIALLIAERYGSVIRSLTAAHGFGPRARLLARLEEEIVLLRRHRGPAAGPVTLNLSQADLATMIGVARQTLNALLRQLQREGLLEISFRRIRVLDPAGLRRGLSVDEGVARRRYRL